MCVRDRKRGGEKEAHGRGPCVNAFALRGRSSDLQAAHPHIYATRLFLWNRERNVANYQGRTLKYIA